MQTENPRRNCLYCLVSSNVGLCFLGCFAGISIPPGNSFQATQEPKMNSSNDNHESTDAESQSAEKLSYEGLGGRRVPFLDLLKIRPLKASDGKVSFEMDIEGLHLRTLGILHGGVTATLMDTALGFAAGTLAPSAHHVVTVQLSLNYIRPGWKGERLIATGSVHHAGQQTAVSRGEIRTSEGVLVAMGTGTFMFIPRPDGSEMDKRDETERCVDTGS